MKKYQPPSVRNNVAAKPGNQPPKRPPARWRLGRLRMANVGLVSDRMRNERPTQPLPQERPCRSAILQNILDQRQFFSATFTASLLSGSPRGAVLKSVGPAGSRGGADGHGVRAIVQSLRLCGSKVLPARALCWAETKATTSTAAAFSTSVLTVLTSSFRVADLFNDVPASLRDRRIGAPPNISSLMWSV